jgi:hypothetical protein
VWDASNVKKPPEGGFLILFLQKARPFARHKGSADGDEANMFFHGDYRRTYPTPPKEIFPNYSE